jgi:hypothetical protein
MPCTDPETGRLIGSHELKLLSDEERVRFEAHLMRCDHCFQDLYRTTPLVAKMTAGDAQHHDGSVVNSGGGRRRWWVWPSILATAAMVLFIAYVPRIFGPAESHERLRGVEEGSIVLYAPIGKVPTPSELDWKIVPPATSYQVAITTPDGDVIWKGTTQAPPLNLPELVRGKLKPGGAYFWQVKALGEKGQAWNSPRMTFTVWD